MYMGLYFGLDCIILPELVHLSAEDLGCVLQITIS